MLIMAPVTFIKTYQTSNLVIIFLNFPDLFPLFIICQKTFPLLIRRYSRAKRPMGTQNWHNLSAYKRCGCRWIAQQSFLTSASVCVLVYKKYVIVYTTPLTLNVHVYTKYLFLIIKLIIYTLDSPMDRTSLHIHNVYGGGGYQDSLNFHFPH